MGTAVRTQLVMNIYAYKERERERDSTYLLFPHIWSRTATLSSAIILVFFRQPKKKYLQIRNNHLICSDMQKKMLPLVSNYYNP